jgi:hypothetical protein
MENIVSKQVDSKQVEGTKEWVAPELKKVAIEELTAHLNLLHPMDDDGGAS